jgi:hypothetical protein
MAEEQYLCKDCKHSFRSLYDIIFWFGVGSKYAYKCRKSWQEDTVETDPVIGVIKVKAKYDNCSSFRIRKIDCGPSAQYWEPKNKKDLFKFMKKVGKDE